MSRHLLAVINDILDISKIEAGRLKLDAREFSPRELLAKVSDMLEERALAKGLTLRTRLDEALPLRLWGDSLRLQQALVNFVGNAIKFSSEGEILISLALLSDDGKQVTIKIEVVDHGIGMTPEQQVRLQEPDMRRRRGQFDVTHALAACAKVLAANFIFARGSGRAKAGGWFPVRHLAARMEIPSGDLRNRARKRCHLPETRRKPC